MCSLYFYNIEEGKGDEQGFKYAQHGENDERGDLVDVQHGGNEGGKHFFEAQMGKNEDNDVS